MCFLHSQMCMRLPRPLVDSCFCRCVLELHAIASFKAEGNGRFAVAMTAPENRRFLAGIERDCNEYYSMIGTVNAETSDCSRAEDRNSIHEAIRKSVGFAKLSRMVFGVMEQWMEEQIRGQVTLHASTGNELLETNWKSVLGALLHLKGQNQDAALLQEDVLSSKRRLLPGNYSNLSMKPALFEYVLLELTHYNTGTSMNNLAETYGALGRHQESLVLKEQAVELLRRWLPENHPEIGKA